MSSANDFTRPNVAQKPGGPAPFDPEKQWSMANLMDWQIVRASRTPGPGQYSLPQMGDESISGGKGGRFGKSGRGKTNVDYLCEAAAAKPGPGEYDTNDDAKISGGSFGTGSNKTAVEMLCDYTSTMPGPSDYSTLAASEYLAGAAGGIKFSKGVHKTHLDHLIYEKCGNGTEDRPGIPAPDHYMSGYETMDWLEGKKGYDGTTATAAGAIKFSTAGRGKTDVDYKCEAAARCPGPGEYDTNDNVLDQIRGGRFGKGKNKTAVEQLCYYTAQTPGPNAYDTGHGNDYLEGKAGGTFQKGAILLSRSAPSVMPFPYSSFAGAAGSGVRSGPSMDFAESLTPWRDKEKWVEHQRSHVFNKSPQKTRPPTPGELQYRGTGFGTEHAASTPGNGHERSGTPWRDEGGREMYTIYA